MCGILGVLSKKVKERKFVSALNMMEHRGPNASGFEFIPDFNLYLGHRRLSILDLNPTGAQPMYSGCGNYLITFNGEIYNYEELKRQLPERFETVKSDTRVLVELISRFGVENTLAKLDGMFALGILDIHKRKITLARDPFGEKPLYYYASHADFSFSSELKPIINLFKSELTLNLHSISEFIKYNYVPMPSTIFNEVQQVLPGSYITIDLDNTDQIVHEIYWDAASERNTEKMECSFDDAAKEFNDLFNESVRRRCISDAPLGAFLSGGYDSTAVVASMKDLGFSNIKTFTIGFQESEFNEAPFAKQISKSLGTDHTELYVPPSEAFNVIPKLATVYDEPFADVSQIPTFLLAQLTRNHVTVALSGDGGDELFAGYSRYLIGTKLWNKVSHLPMSVRRILGYAITDRTLNLAENVNQLLPRYKQIKNLTERSKKITKLLTSKNSYDFYKNLTTHDVAPREILAFEVSESFGDTFPEDDNLISEMMFMDLKNYLPLDILTKVDRATMANSLETRTPFLTKDLYSFSKKIPFEYLHDGLRGKIILKDYVHKRVPRGLVERPKMGFGVPISKWLKNDLKPWMLDTLNEKDLRDRGIFNPVAIKNLITDHENGKGNKHNSLWNVIILMQWLKEYDFSL